MFSPPDATFLKKIGPEEKLSQKKETGVWLALKSWLGFSKDQRYSWSKKTQKVYQLACTAFLVLLIFDFLVGVTSLIDIGPVQEKPGQVLDLSKRISGPDFPSSNQRGHLLLLTVISYQPTVFSLVTKDSVSFLKPKHTSNAAKLQGDTDMHEAKQNAWEVAAGMLRAFKQTSTPAYSVSGSGFAATSLPFTDSVDTSNVNGPSGGLMLTLALLDASTPGTLQLGGAPLAGTGTVDPYGSIGPVGGIFLKEEAAFKAGARIILVPAANYEEARIYAPKNLTVIGINSINQALVYLCDNGATDAICSKI